MIASVVKRNFDIDHLVTSENSAPHSFLDTLFNRLDVLLGNRAGLDVVRELVPLAGPVWLDTNRGMAIVAHATCLLDVFAFPIGYTKNCLAVVRRRLTHAHNRVQVREEHEAA